MGVVVWVMGKSWSVALSVALPLVVVGPVCTLCIWWLSPTSEWRNTSSVRRVRVMGVESRDTVVVTDEQRTLRWRVVLTRGSANLEPGLAWATEPFTAHQRIVLVVAEPLGSGRHAVEPREGARTQRRLNRSL